MLSSYRFPSALARPRSLLDCGQRPFLHLHPFISHPDRYCSAKPAVTVDCLPLTFHSQPQPLSPLQPPSPLRVRDSRASRHHLCSAPAQLTGQEEEPVGAFRNQLVLACTAHRRLRAPHYLDRPQPDRHHIIIDTQVRTQATLKRRWPQLVSPSAETPPMSSRCSMTRAVLRRCTAATATRANWRSRRSTRSASTCSRESPCTY